MSRENPDQKGNNPLTPEITSPAWRNFLVSFGNFWEYQSSMNPFNRWQSVASASLLSGLGVGLATGNWYYLIGFSSFWSAAVCCVVPCVKICIGASEYMERSDREIIAGIVGRATDLGQVLESTIKEKLTARKIPTDLQKLIVDHFFEDFGETKAQQYKWNKIENEGEDKVRIDIKSGENKENLSLDPADHLQKQNFATSEQFAHSTSTSSYHSPYNRASASDEHDKVVIRKPISVKRNSEIEISDLTPKTKVEDGQAKKITPAKDQSHSRGGDSNDSTE